MENRKKAYSVDEAAEVLGISPWLVREAVRRDEIRCIRIGRRIIIPAAVIDQLLAAPDNRGEDEERRPSSNVSD